MSKKFKVLVELKIEVDADDHIHASAVAGQVAAGIGFCFQGRDGFRDDVKYSTKLKEVKEMEGNDVS